MCLCVRGSARLCACAFACWRARACGFSRGCVRGASYRRNLLMAKRTYKKQPVTQPGGERLGVGDRCLSCKTIETDSERIYSANATLGTAGGQRRPIERCPTKLSMVTSGCLVSPSVPAVPVSNFELANPAGGSFKCGFKCRCVCVCVLVCASACLRFGVIGPGFICDSRDDTLL